MTEVRSFRGVRYNQALVESVASVICPPYDIITPEMRKALYARSEYNFVRLESVAVEPEDTAADSRYTRPANTLSAWLKQGILKIDDTPAIYLDDHYFKYQGEEYRRRGIIASVKLEEWDKKIIRPHEGTFDGPKVERVNLLRALKTDVSPVFGLYEDVTGDMAAVLSAEASKEPVIVASYADGERHNVWAVTDPGAIRRIYAALADQPLYIADGHHRYESALIYRDEARAALGSTTADAAFDYVMMTLVEFQDPGLLMLPPHRLARNISKEKLKGVMAQLESIFIIDEIPLDTDGSWQKVDAFLGEGEVSQDRLVIFGLVPRSFLLLRLRDFGAVVWMMPEAHSELYKRLVVSIIDHVILAGLLDIDSSQEETVGYNYDSRDTVKKVLDNEYEMAILLSPIRAEVIRDIADIGDRMPRKSTYFYPKLPSGLVCYRLE